MLTLQFHHTVLELCSTRTDTFTVSFTPEENYTQANGVEVKNFSGIGFSQAWRSVWGVLTIYAIITNILMH